MDNNKRNTFLSLDLGTGKPTAVKTETITVKINGGMFGDFGRAFVKEGFRVNPLLAEQVQLTDSEVEQYCYFLLQRRVECCTGKCSDFRLLKSLYIPVWIQYNLAMIGNVTNRQYGIKLVPEYDGPEVITFEEAAKISDKIGAFENDLQLVKDAFPRSDEGDKDVMSTALIADYTRSIQPVEHVASTYVSAFLGMKLKEEIEFARLYRIQYDDIEYIKSVLIREKSLY